MDTFNQLAVILSNEIGVRRQDITLHARLREDLKIDGDDVHVLFSKITENWKIDWHGFVFYRYFHEEPHLFSLLFNWYYRLRHGILKTITVSHLMLVIEHGVWFEPSLSSRSI
ncbi:MULTISPECIES: DUF1493 family protein [Nostocales]|uniref:DUF1493 family protein n=3 Tax=Nostocales TaxID=1161 RepID=A0A0C1N1M5_9CYAN|nr:DUF1493 family protein [Tolypothrix bouteillei]KAF3883729.1 DUF1493 family protein [Tolypothrix bouteillei VB521301]